MINLLNPTYKKELSAARANSLLMLYVILLFAVVLLLVVEVALSYLVLAQEDANNKSIVSENNSKTSSYTSTKQQAAQFTGELSTAKYILDKQTPFTAIILKIASVLPSGADLNGLSIDPKTFGTPTIISVKVRSYDEAIAIKDSLQKSDVFKDVNFSSISNEGEGPNSSQLTASYNVTYSKDLLKLK